MRLLGCLRATGLVKVQVTQCNSGNYNIAEAAFAVPHLWLVPTPLPPSPVTEHPVLPLDQPPTALSHPLCCSVQNSPQAALRWKSTPVDHPARPACSQVIINTLYFFLKKDSSCYAMLLSDRTDLCIR